MGFRSIRPGAGRGCDDSGVVFRASARRSPSSTRGHSVCGRFLDLDGAYSFDALSPNGRWLYLIQYTSRHDPTRYAVRAYDLRAGRMLPKPIVDPTEPDEAMRGYPVTRATTPDGRWEYTLYDGAGSHPFVHALDTVGRKALCLDLDVLEGDSNLGNLRLQPETGGTITVHYRGTPMAFIDRDTRQVTEPALPPSPPPDRATRPEPLPRGVQIGPHRLPGPDDRRGRGARRFDRAPSLNDSSRPEAAQS